jgi:extracellular factor (EF) 3-hydroxypalmitic acid methyl ester biosynthesis protein
MHTATTAHTDVLTTEFRQLHQGLNQARLSAGDGWRRLRDGAYLAHPLADAILREPIVRRARTKPRGYADDAVLIDHFYDFATVPAADGAVRALSETLVTFPAARSVRWRRDHLARTIDEVAESRPGAAVVSVACGHLREAALSRAVTSRRLGSFHAMDQDAASLAVVESEYGRFGVTPVHASVRDVLTGRTRFEGADLIYSAGLYDYLEDRVAVRLTARLFSMLAPGGRLVVANFAPSLSDIGFMETFMDWNLVYRDADDMARLAGEIAPHEVGARTHFVDGPGNVHYLELVRA